MAAPALVRVASDLPISNGLPCTPVGGAVTSQRHSASIADPAPVGQSATSAATASEKNAAQLIQLTSRISRARTWAPAADRKYRTRPQAAAVPSAGTAKPATSPSVMTPDWLDAFGYRVRARLIYPAVIGHVDWEACNLRWSDDGAPRAVHGWDSLAAQPESLIAGLAAAVHTTTDQPGTEATTSQASAFLTAYQQARGLVFTPDEVSQSHRIEVDDREPSQVQPNFRRVAAGRRQETSGLHRRARRRRAPCLDGATNVATLTQNRTALAERPCICW